MKKKISILFYLVLISGVLLLLISRCSKLEEKPTDFVGPDNFYNTTSQIEAAFTASMQRLWGGWQFYDWMGSPQFPSLDDEVYDGDLVIGDDFANDCWSTHYKAIADLNPAIKALVDDKLGTTVSQEVKDELMAQAKFLRAWNYFFLVRLYGDVPLITENSNVVTDEIKRTPTAEVYALIVEDMLFATQHLPEAWGEEGKARPTADVARTMLAKVYITMAGFPMSDASKYVNARDMAKQVMDNGNYHLVTPVEDVFKLENTFGPEMMWSFHNSTEEYVIEPQVWLPGDMANGWGDVTAEKIWGEAYPEEPRKHAYLLLNDVIFGTGTTYMDWGKSAPFVRKYLYDSPENLEKNVSYEAFPIIRYADALLLYAEAENQVNGPTQEACDAVNQIVNRATGGVANPADPLFTTSMTKEEFDDAVIYQRSLELCFEYDRWFTICRKRILDKVCDPVNALPNYNIEDYLMPIPQKDLRLNPLLTQNPGYTTPTSSK
jgi:starch-binding outer membrane protein, SusD/RagB family